MKPLIWFAVLLACCPFRPLSGGETALPPKETRLRIVWEKLPDLPVAAAGQTLIIDDGQLYVLGGSTWRDGRKCYLDSISRLISAAVIIRRDGQVVLIRFCHIRGRCHILGCALQFEPVLIGMRGRTLAVRILLVVPFLGECEGKRARRVLVRQRPSFSDRVFCVQAV